MLPSISDPAEYGLPFSDYASDEVVDPNTEQTAASYEAHAVDVAAMSHTAPRAIVHVVFDGGGVPSVYAYDSVWGSDVAVRPSVTDNGVGDVTLTWTAAGYPDLNPTPARRVTRAPAFRFAHGSRAGNTFAFVLPVVTTNTVQVLTLDESATNVDADFYLFVY